MTHFMRALTNASCENRFEVTVSPLVPYESNVVCKGGLSQKLLILGSKLFVLHHSM